MHGKQTGYSDCLKRKRLQIEGTDMERGKSIVVAVPCYSYDPDTVYEAVRVGIRELGGLERLLRPEERVLVKPNFLKPADADSAVTTHPAVILAVLRMLQEFGSLSVRFGDSSGHDVGEHVADKLGLTKDAQLYGADIAPMTEEIKVSFPEGITEKEFYFAKEVSETDAIISVCKMKTHALMRITGAVKNLFGLTCGFRKAREHVKFPNANVFAGMLVDIHRCVKPRLHIMDAVVAMEGNGPGAGTPTSMNLLLFSTDPVAIDSVFCSLIRIDPETVPTNVQGEMMGLGTYHNDRIQIILAKADSTMQRESMTVEEFSEAFGNPAFDTDRRQKGMLMRGLGVLERFTRRPVIRKDRCIHCGICVSHCPVPGKALSFKNGKDQPPVYDRTKCIRCYCCQEMCPQKAITAGWRQA